MGKTKRMDSLMERSLKAGWHSQTAEGQKAYFGEYRDAARDLGIMSETALDAAVNAGMPSYITYELFIFLGMLNEEIQFLLSDGLITYFSRGKREYSGLRMLDMMLDVLYDEMDPYLIPFIPQDKKSDC